MHLIPPHTAIGYGSAAVTPHELSTQAALELMSSGGNAIDGAIAANAVQAVVAPETCGIGGDLFALIHQPGAVAPVCLNASGRAGSGASAETLRSAGHETMPLFGPESITVPGCVDGWFALHSRFGSRPLAEILSPAMQLATEGFPASTELARSWSRNAEQLMSQASGAPMFPNMRPPERGDRIRRPLLAESLGAILAGRDSFYLDRIGTAITSTTNGWITSEDLSRDQAEWVDPISIDVFGKTAWTVPPNTQGYLTLATLAIFEATTPTNDPSDPAYAHHLIEAYRAMIGERADTTTDPDTSPLSNDDLLDRNRLMERAAALDPNRAGRMQSDVLGTGGTAYLCTVDDAGMGVSFIQSNFHGIGSGLSAGDTGVWLHNRGGGFTLEEDHPNELTPGRRPLHTLSPTLWTDDGELAMVLGTRGGHQQPQLLAQLAANRFHADIDLAAAQAYPRWTISEGEEPESHVLVEDRMEPSVVAGLRTRGHDVEVQGPWMGGWGPISAIEVVDGRRHGVADPRVDTSLALAR
jgi:gamma-glutamyltranspeptidase/glutathione hydrolase